MYNSSSVLIFFLIVLLMGCSSTIKDWEIAKEKDSIVGYKRFAQKHTDSEFDNEVKNSIERLTFKETKLKHSIKAYTEFLNKYPSGKYSNEARLVLDSLNAENAWQEALERDTFNSYKQFFIQFPHGSHAKIAREAIKLSVIASSIFEPEHENDIQSIANIFIDILRSEGFSILSQNQEKVQFEIYVYPRIGESYFQSFNQDAHGLISNFKIEKRKVLKVEYYFTLPNDNTLMISREDAKFEVSSFKNDWSISEELKSVFLKSIRKNLLPSLYAYYFIMQ